MRTTLRRNEDGGVNGASAEIIFAVGTDAEVSGIAIQPSFHPGLEGVAWRGPGKAVLALKEITIGGHHRPGGRVESFKEAIDKLQRGIGVVRRGKRWCCARDAQ